MVDNGQLVSRGSTPADYSTDVIAARALADIHNVPAGRPFYGVVTPYGTHGPWTAAPQDVGRNTGVVVPKSAAYNEADVSDKPAYIQALSPQPRSLNYEHRAAWDTALSVDRMLQALDQQLLADGRYDSTVIMVTSDNGFSWGDHRWKYKKCEYTSCMQVPLYVRYPGQPAAVHTGLVTIVDYATTFADIAGATPLVPQDGQSFLTTLQGGPEPARPDIVERWGGGGTPGPRNPQGFMGLRTADWLYVELTSGERELYDRSGLRGPADPLELTNRAGDPAYADVEAQLAAQLAAESAGEPPPHTPSSAAGIDD